VLEEDEDEERRLLSSVKVSQVVVSCPPHHQSGPQRQSKEAQDSVLEYLMEGILWKK
jgi:hypothetical protein